MISFVKKKATQTYLALCGKTNYPVHLITACAILSSKNCNKVFEITSYNPNALELQTGRSPSRKGQNSWFH